MSPHQLSDYNVAWICALPLELAAACAMLDDRHDPLPLDYDSRDTNNYILGRIESHNVVLACLPYGVTGTVSAAKVVSQLLLTFQNIKFGLVIGIGGGAPRAEHDNRVGDVVGSPTGLLGGVVQYDFGKTVQHGRFQRTGMLNKPSQVLLPAMSRLQARHLMEGHHVGETINGMLAKYPAMCIHYSRPSSENDRLYLADYEHPESQPTCSSCDTGQMVTRHSRPAGISEPYIHYGLIASGDQVVRNGQMRDRLRKELDVLCFEMEAAGLIDSFPCLVLRGISDYADSHKNDLWQGYVAAASAAYAKELMGLIKAGGNTDRKSLNCWTFLAV
ncbi:nucleoside phosphorylase domain-containing protein [Aspergillus egyptiacus]|nr:nucleoside phosphorylase domain-containing protein [Aspergillus egyptiacus]